MERYVFLSVAFFFVGGFLLFLVFMDVVSFLVAGPLLLLLFAGLAHLRNKSE